MNYHVLCIIYIEKEGGGGGGGIKKRRKRQEKGEKTEQN